MNPLRFKLSLPKRPTPGSTLDVKFQASFKKGDFALRLEDEGLSNTTVKSAPVDVDVVASYLSEIRYGVVPQLYTAKQGKTGKTK